MRGKFHLRPPDHDEPLTPERLFLLERPAIEEVIRAVARRRGMHAGDAEEFAATVRLRLIQDDYDILRKYESRASLRTYLTVVIHRLALDYQAATWGKWRPSAAARAGGPAAMRLEQLVVRDGVPLDAALDTVQREQGAPVDRQALAQAARRFPPRARRGFAGEEVLEALASEAPDVEQILIREEEAGRFGRIAARAGELIAALPDQDRFILQMRFEQGLTVARIARMLDLDQKRLYRTVERILDSLRQQLEAEGVRGVEVARLLEASESTPGAKPARPVRLSEGEA